LSSLKLWLKKLKPDAMHRQRLVEEDPDLLFTF